MVPPSCAKVLHWQELTPPIKKKNHLKRQTIKKKKIKTKIKLLYSTFNRLMNTRFLADIVPLELPKRELFHSSSSHAHLHRLHFNSNIFFFVFLFKNLPSHFLFFFFFWPDSRHPTQVKKGHVALFKGLPAKLPSLSGLVLLA